MNRRLMQFALRRPLTLSFFVAALIAYFASRTTSGIVFRLDMDAAKLEALCTAFLLLAAPLVVVSAAQRSHALARTLRVTRIRPWGAAGSLAIGSALGAIFAFAIATVAPFRIHFDDVERLLGAAGRAPAAASALISSDAPARWRIEAPDEPGLWLSVPLSLEIAPGGGSEARLVARRGERANEARAWIQARGRVEVELPAGAGPVELELALPEDGARGFWTEDHSSLWRMESGGAAGWRCFARIACALATWSALAWGLAAWVQPITALLALLAAWVALWASGVAPRWLPGGDLPGVLTLLGEGRAPQAAGLAPWAVCAALVTLSAALGKSKESA